jgi:hypothetical protein
MMNDEGGNRNGGERNGEMEWLELHPVYDAADEATAIHVQALLTGVGIAARVRSAQIPGFDGAFAMAVGYWGQVMVAWRDVVRAKALLEAFEEELGREDPPGPSERGGNEGTDKGVDVDGSGNA